jgi:hypothetical protein
MMAVEGVKNLETYESRFGGVGRVCTREIVEGKSDGTLLRLREGSEGRGGGDQESPEDSEQSLHDDILA